MKLVVFGATGGTGRELVKQALGHGHEVRAFARDPDRVKTVHPRLEVVRGDVLEPETITPVLAGMDGVLCALGTSPRKPGTTLSDGVRNLVAAMEQQGVSRLVFVSSLGVGSSKGHFGLVYERIFIPLLMKELFADKETAEQVIQGSSLEWTIVRPAMLRNGWLTGHYRVGAEAEAGWKLLPRIRRADLADFMLTAIERRQYIRETPALRY
jgi:uncharacterized protein YbjT (DUF2867 family)